MQASSSSRQSINRKLTRTVFLVTVTTLVIACLLLLAFDWFALRASIKRNTETLAEVVGTNSAVALTFYDPVTAQETLGAFRAVKTVEAAVIYDRGGRPFASYVSDAAGANFTPPPVPSVGHEFGIGKFELTRAIVFNGETVGTIFIQKTTTELTQRIERYVAVVGILLLAVALVTWGVYSRLRRLVAAPLTDLAQASAAIAGGDLSTEVPVRTDDEIGTLARTFNAMTDSLGAIVGQVLQSIRDVGEVSQSLQQIGRKMAEEAQRQSLAIDETAESIEQLGSSIVEVNTNVAQVSDSARETSSSIVEMDASIVSVAEHMDHLSDSIEATSAGVIQVASGTDQVVSGVGTLTSATNESMERLQELRRSVHQVREDASASHTLCDDTSQEATKGMEAVNETTAAMNEISISFGDLEQSVSRLANNSKSIGEILQVIRDVAEQTSMLSLNASIIAAQAGEHGKAFSVVADEVNNLAGRTHRSTQEIAKLVQAVQDDTAAAVAAAEEGSAKVDKGVQRSNVAGKVLAKISEKSKSSTEMVHSIFEASTQQYRDLERVEQAMAEVKEIVAQINRSTRDQQTATSEIAKAVENIRSLGKGVKVSTDEQRRGSRLMTDSVTHVATMIEQIAEATQAQTKSNETIQHALQVFQDVTTESSHRADELGTMVGTLSQRCDRLEEAVGRFKTE